MIHLAVNRNATTRDYVKVEKLLNDIGSINRVEELFPKVQTELATFQSTEQTNYTINFYRSLKENVGAARAAIVSEEYVTSNNKFYLWKQLFSG